MRVAVASTYVPFISGGGTMIVDSLVENLAKFGYSSEKILFPLRSYWPDLSEQTLALRLFDLTVASGTKIDRLVTIRYPSYAIPHSNKMSWFIHHHRGAYDLWGTEYQDIPNTPEGLAFRENLIRYDTFYLKECKKIYALSHAVAERLRVFNNIVADGVLYHAHPNAQLFQPGEQGNYFIYAQRIVPIKRQYLAIEAMRHVKSDFKLVLVGSSDEPSYIQKMRQLVKQYRLEGRVKFTGWISESEKAKLISNSFAAMYLAYGEDSYGYSTLEGFHCAKPMVTLKDSGATNEVIKDGFNGLVPDPDPEVLADAMEKLWADRSHALEMGKNAQETLNMHQISWDHIVEVVTS